GDMLYMSGDSPAPVRLQGVFVSDTEINNITRAWRAQMTEEDLIAASRPITSNFQDDTTRAVGDPRDNIGGAAWNPLVTGRGTPAQPTTGRPQGTTQSAPVWDQEARATSTQSMRAAEDDDEELDDADADAMYDQAVELVRTMKKASVSLLQRRLRIGYTRAARLIDLMEERGVVGPAKDGSIPRDVIG
ncbi:MAG: DNA translocase FtsK, partial [Anaerolineae bacterium]